MPLSTRAPVISMTPAVRRASACSGRPGSPCRDRCPDPGNSSATSHDRGARLDLVDPRPRRRAAASASRSPAASSPSARCACTRGAASARSSTQALMNPLYGPAGPRRCWRRAVRRPRWSRPLTAADAGRDQRQLHVLPARGRRRGAHRRALRRLVRPPWCGDDFSVAGNMLAGPQVLEATAEAYRRAAPGGRSPSACSPRMAAGEAAGGDKRGKQAAALRIHATRTIPSSTCASTTTPSRSPNCGASTR